MENNIIKNSKRNYLNVIIVVLLVTGVLLLVYKHFGTRYVILPQGSNVKEFNAQYVIPFDPAKIKLENINKYNEVKKILQDEYYMGVDDNVLIEGSIAGMTESLKDPYTVYFTKEQMRLFNEKAEGSYVGIGVTITVDPNGLLTVVETFEGSPAQKSGMIKGDKIIKIDDKDVTSLRDDTLVIGMIKGKENSKVKITVFRPSDGKSIDLTVTRKRIKVSNIESKLLANDIGYIRIMSFDSEIADYFNNHLNKLLQRGIKGLVIDVRDNPGGDYQQVVRIADRLIPKGTIVYTENRKGQRKVERSDDVELKLPMTVLVNGNSASASEVLAGALKDHKKATLVGTKTFGKGLVQSVVELSDGSGLKITIARYFTPSGVCIQGKGIQPDTVVEEGEKYKETPISQIPNEEDLQLIKAQELCQKGM